MLATRVGFFSAVAEFAFALIAYGQTGAVQPAFEVASIKRHVGGGESGITVTPGRFSVANLPVRRLIFNAYKVTDFQILGAPGSMNSEMYDIEAKGETRFSASDMLLMLQLGLKLESGRGPVAYLMIDHIERTEQN